METLGQKIAREYREKQEFRKLHNVPTHSELCNMIHRGEVALIDFDSIDIKSNQYHWVKVSAGKYSRLMFCIKTRVARDLTFDEFYSGSIID